MKKIKIIGISIGVLIILIVLISFVLPRKIIVERSGIINANPEQVFEQINTMQNWKNWSPWHQIDSNTVYAFNQIPASEGASYSWVSENKDVGKGSLTILKSIKNDSIAAELSFESQGKSICYYTFEKNELGVNVKFGMICDAAYNPMARYFNLFMNKILGKDFEKGIQNLKLFCENLPKQSKFDIKEDIFTGVTFIGIKDSCKATEVSSKMGQLFGLLMPFIYQNNIKPISAPIAIYHSFSPDKVVFELGLPIKEGVEVKTNNKIKINKLQKSNVVVANFYGSYDSIKLAYAEIDKWLVANNKTPDKICWEEYLTDPLKEKDTAKWQTKIYFQLK